MIMNEIEIRINKLPTLGRADVQESMPLFFEKKA
jgi:hypothetical protein